MSFRNKSLIVTGVLGVGLSLGGAGISHAVTGDGAPTVDSGQARSSIYNEAHTVAIALRGGPASAAAQRPLSLEFVTSLLRAASFDEGEPAPAQWTLFLPIDASFTRLGGVQLDTLIHDPAGLRALIDRHLVAESVTLDDMKRSDSARSIDGQALDASLADTPHRSGVAVIAEQTVENGRVFIIDGLL
jgi:uncharacterized surface protein with fasciclin (FAS1) repeats